jgi:anion-transporting  ArsA/GET3 family ATPase
MIQKQFEIFCGTGGVGKTTLATSRAFHLASCGQKVLLITIDPAKRLKELLGLSEEQAGDVQSVSLDYDGKTIEFDALLMSPDKTIESMAHESGVESLSDNRILKILAKPYGGMNEILSVVEVQRNLDKKIYSTIILDTPPGSHFVDFLKSCQKIQTFFDRSFMEVFKYLRQSKAAQNANIFKKVMATGIKKLMDYLQSVTGAVFIDDFLGAVDAIYQAKDVFLNALNLQEDFKDPAKSNWFLVTAVDHSKLKEAINLKKHADSFIHKDNFICLNKYAKEQWQGLEAPVDSSLGKLRDKHLAHHEKLEDSLKQVFNNLLIFTEIFEISPLEHVRCLAKQWQ